MAIGTLDFSLPKPGWLNFGRTAPPGNELALQATLPVFSGSLNWVRGKRLAVRCTVVWGGGVPMPARQTVIGSTPTPLDFGQRIVWGEGLPTTARQRIGWNAGMPVQAGQRIAWQSSLPTITAQRIVWNGGQPILTAQRSVWGDGQPTITGQRIVWSGGQLLSVGRVVRWAAGLPIAGRLRVRWAAGLPVGVRLRLWWAHARPPAHGRTRSLHPSAPPGRVLGSLNFVCPAPGRLNFGNTCFGSGRLLVPIQESYIVLNASSLIRLADGADIPVSDLTLTLGIDSWCWTLAASIIDRAGYERIPQAPGRVQATVNGFPFRFVVDEVTFQRGFNKFSGSLSGRSPLALLSAPFSGTKSAREASLKTAAQLALQELPLNYALDWQLPDWSVPGGVFQYENLTVMEIITRIVKAAGGRVVPDPTDDLLLHAVPKWRQKPWAWAFVPDVTLPSSYTLEEHLSQSAGARYESILVSGGAQQGVVVQATREGTGGMSTAPAQQEALLTALEPATAKAIQALADLWPMRRFSLSMPLQAPPDGAGLILPGTTLDFADGLDGWRGLVVETKITARWNEGMQHLEVVSP